MKKRKNLFNVMILSVLILMLIAGVLITIKLYNNPSENSESLENGNTNQENYDSVKEKIPECVPKTCNYFDTECGYISDGCGNQIYCGNCMSGYECISNECKKIVEEVDDIEEGCVIGGEETGEHCDYPSDCYELAFSMGEEDMRSVFCLGGNNEINYGSDLVREFSDTEVEAGETFTLTYYSNREGTWGASMIDSVSGGCKFSNGKNIIKTVILSQGGPTNQVYEITLPNYPTTCVFVGDYMFGSEGLKNFVDVTIEVQ